MLCEIERLGRSISAKPNVVTFGVNYDGVFTREAQSFMHRLAEIKYPAVEGCQNYLVTRSNWIDHWVKAIQSGLVNTLARGMAQSYTDLAAQHAIARVETRRPLSPPPVPQGVPRFTSRGIAHQTKEAFPEYLQPEVTFIDGSAQVEMVDTDNGDGSPAISPASSRSQGNGGLSEHQWRHLLATPPCGPLPRLPSEQMVTEPEEFELMQESPVSHAATRSIALVRLSDAGAIDDSRFLADDSLDHVTSPSLVPHSQSIDPASSIAESSQSIIPPSEEPKHKKYDMVQVLSQTRKDGRIYRAVGRVRCADPTRPHYVRLYGYKKGYGYRRVLQNFTRQWTLMTSNDAQSSSDDSISQSY